MNKYIDKPIIGEIMHNCPDVFEKMFGKCKEIKLTDLNCNIEPSNNGCFTFVKK